MTRRRVWHAMGPLPRNCRPNLRCGSRNEPFYQTQASFLSFARWPCRRWGLSMTDEAVFCFAMCAPSACGVCLETPSRRCSSVPTAAPSGADAGVDWTLAAAQPGRRPRSRVCRPSPPRLRRASRGAGRMTTEQMLAGAHPATARRSALAALAAAGRAPVDRGSGGPGDHRPFGACQFPRIGACAGGLDLLSLHIVQVAEKGT